ncbi:MAG: hypothetical protein ACYDHW_01050 [Syntrophorhabdaceae bacterium]
MKRFFVIMFAVLVFFSFALASNAATIKKKSATATQNIDYNASVRPKAEAKDRAAVEKQQKQQENMAKAKDGNVGSSGGNVSSTEKKKQVRTKTNTQGQPPTGTLPKD